MITVQIPQLKRQGWHLPAILLLGLILRLYLLGSKSFWQDEGYTWYIPQGIIHDEAHQPLFNGLLHLFLSLFGNNEFAGRLLSVVVGVLLIWITFLFIRAVFDRRAALIGALLVAISPFAVLLSQEMRPYSLILLEIAISIYFFYQLYSASQSNSKTLQWWIALYLIALVGLYTHIIVAAQILFFTVIFFLGNYRNWRRLLHWGILLILLIIGFLPQLFTTLHEVQVKRNILIASGLGGMISNLRLILKSLVTFFIGIPSNSSSLCFSNFFRACGGNYLILIGLILMLIILILILRKNKLKNLLRSGFGLRMISAAFVFNLFLYLVLEVSSPRQLVGLYFPFVVFLAYILSSINLSWRRILMFGIGVISVISLYIYYRLPYFPYEEINWAQAGRFLKKQAQSSDLIFFQGGRNGFYTLKYYIGDLPCAGKYLDSQKWEPDVYQSFKYDQFYRHPDECLAQLVSQYPRIWYLHILGGQKLPHTNLNIAFEPVSNFGPELEILLLKQNTGSNQLPANTSPKEGSIPNLLRH